MRRAIEFVLYLPCLLSFAAFLLFVRLALGTEAVRRVTQAVSDALDEVK